MASIQPHLSHPKYRPDIDGLRALAVLSVVAFHAFPNWLKGGFVGVDVFFVISGYLISTIIFENLDRGTFSFAEFYARRIKRIFPALILVLVANYAFGWFALLADEFKQLGKHIAAGAGFVSNIVLWNEAGYFDNSAETKPLLHLWSLGIEEQFYIVWPLLLWLAWKRKFNLLIITILVTVVSFYLNVKGIKKFAVATFYSPQTRFWELFCGSLLAWVMLYKKGAFDTVKAKVNGWLASALYREKHEADWQTLSNVLSFVGLFLLAYGFWRINKELRFPGKWAVVPVLGAVLIIFAGPKAWVNRTILSNKIAVWFGLISFPLYLWHWPLLSFARIIESGTPSRSISTTAVVLSIVLAWLTYRLVERPIRLGKQSYAKLLSLAISMLVVCLVGLATFKGDGFPMRKSLIGINQDSGAIERLTEDDPISHSKCMGMYGLLDQIRYCSVSIESKPKIAIIGDSHAAVLYKGLSEVLELEGKGLLNIGGRLFLDVATYPLGSNADVEICKGGIRATEFVAKEESIDTVIMVSRGPFYLSGEWIFQLFSDPSITDRKRVWDVAMRKTLDKFVGVKKQVIFVLDNPEIDFDPLVCVQRPFRLSWHVESNCAIPRVQFDSRNKEYRDLVFNVLKDYSEVKIFDVAAYLCDSDRCLAKLNGKVLYRDSDHLSLEGARLIAKELAKVINGADSNILNH